MACESLLLPCFHPPPFASLSILGIFRGGGGVFKIRSRARAKRSRLARCVQMDKGGVEFEEEGGGVSPYCGEQTPQFEWLFLAVSGQHCRRRRPPHWLPPGNPPGGDCPLRVTKATGAFLVQGFTLGGGASMNSLRPTPPCSPPSSPPLLLLLASQGSRLGSTPPPPLLWCSRFSFSWWLLSSFCCLMLGGFRAPFRRRCSPALLPPPPSLLQLSGPGALPSSALAFSPWCMRCSLFSWGFLITSPCSSEDSKEFAGRRASTWVAICAPAEPPRPPCSRLSADNTHAPNFVDSPRLQAASPGPDRPPRSGGFAPETKGGLNPPASSPHP